MVKKQLFAFIACFAGAAANELVQDIIIRSFVNANATVIPDPANRANSVLNQPAECSENNTALVGGEEFPCDNVDFLSFLAYKDMEIKERFHYFNRHAADIWGWLSPTGREFTLIAMDNGVAVIDSTNATNPCIIAKLPSALPSDIWADVKVYKDTLYHVKDQRGAHPVPNRNFSIEVFDLLPFDSINCHAEGFTPKLHFPNFINSEHGRSHNLAVNTESGRIYTVGANTCRGGLNVFDVSENRLQPKFLACVDGDNYTHDAQCVTYDGPDTRFTGKEICFAFNEDTLTIWDLTTPTKPVMLSRTLYFNQAYSHQGWLNRGMTKVMLDDELDELCNDAQGKILYAANCARLVASGLSGETRTSTTVFDVTDLENPVVESRYIHKDRSIDHNLYVWGAIHEKGWGGNPPMENFPDPNFMYLNNYMAGLRIVDIHDNNASNWFEAGYFDVTPNETFLEFFGAWSGYMHPSGVYAISSIERGLFLVKPKTAFTEEFPQTPAPTPVAVPALTDGAVAGIMIGVLVVIFVAIFVLVIVQNGKNVTSAAVGSPSGEVDSGTSLKHYTKEVAAKETL